MAGLSLALVLAAFISLLVACARDGPSAPKREAADFAARWGVQVESIRSTAAGRMLDFRYRVVDPEKAQSLFKRQTKPYLIDQETGARFVVPNPPTTGPLRSSNTPKRDRTYFMFFANPGGLIKRGKQVTVVIGDFRAENLIVQ
jgi:hypothetical protein